MSYTEIITDTTRSGSLLKSQTGMGLPWNTVWSAVNADSVDRSLLSLRAHYLVEVTATGVAHRMGYIFDTSLIPSDAIIKSINLLQYINSKRVDAGWEIILIKGLAGKPSDPIVVGDFDRTLWDLQIGSKDESLISELAYASIAITDLTVLIIGGLTKFYALLSLDYNNAPDGKPTMFNWGFFGDGSTGPNPPKLEVTYALPPRPGMRIIMP
jgi:hypothetical protein